MTITMSSAHSQTLPSLHLRHSSFYNPSVTSPTSQLILKPFRHFTYVTAHSTTLPLLHLCHSSFSNHSVTSPTSQLILQSLRPFTYVHNSIFNPAVASSTSQLILQPFFRFSYVTRFSLTSPGEPSMTDTRVLQILLLSIHIPKIAPKMSQP